MTRALASLLVAAALAGCSGSSAAAGGALVNVAVGTAVAAHRRSQGECYTPCVKGTACNEKTGMCDELPCRGECREDQLCVTDGLIPHCVAGGGQIALTPRADAGTHSALTQP